MKKLFSLFTVFAFVVSTCIATTQNITKTSRIFIPLSVKSFQITTPIEPVTPDMPPRPRTPIYTPELSHDGHTIYIDISCIGDTLQLVNEDGEVVYSVTIADEETTLPATIEGTFELQIIHGNLCFYGDIEL